MLGEGCNSHASATDITVAPSSSATKESAEARIGRRAGPTLRAMTRSNALGDYLRAP